MSEFEKDKEVTTDYLNNKLESMMTAIFDSLEEMEIRMRNIEKLFFEMKNGSTDKTEK